ncbi:MAG: hypothetical protein Kow0031_13540 [Anaerolineae bacterium]
MTNPYLLKSNRMRLLLAVLLIIVIALESVALYAVFTSKFSGGNDFFVYWLGGQEYLLYGTNPFDPAVAGKIQQAIFGRPVQPGDKDQAYFAYPLYSLYFSWPLSLLPYPWARAIWMTLLQFMLLAVTGLSIHLASWRPKVWLWGVSLLWGVLFYSGARAIVLGQFSVLVGLALLLALWAVEQHRDVWAGMLLAVTTIKPQMVILLLVFLLVWAIFQRRWRLIGGFFTSMLFLMISSVLLVPTWPLDFVRNAIAYAKFIQFGTPLENLLHYFLPANLAAPATFVLSIILFLALLPGWWLAWRAPIKTQPAGPYLWAILTTLIVGNLITFRSATTNQIILYLPLFFYFRRLSGYWAWLAPPLIELSLLILVWAVFIKTLEGNWEHPMLHGLLPTLILLLYALDWTTLRRISQEQLDA